MTYNTTQYNTIHYTMTQAYRDLPHMPGRQAPTHAPALGLGPRVLPTTFQPRALGAAVGGGDASYLGQVRQCGCGCVCMCVWGGGLRVCGGVLLWVWVLVWV